MDPDSKVDDLNLDLRKDEEPEYEEEEE